MTGGAGYIGSHACVALLQDGHDVVVVDNLANSFPEAINAVRDICGRALTFYRADVGDEQQISAILRTHRIDAVMHFAGLKAVGESVERPLAYYQNNITGTLQLLQAMTACNVHRIIFSSSATVYGNADCTPIGEDAPLGATNPYGRTKQFIEEILADVARSDDRWRISLLRYFNPVGAHPSGLIGEDPNGPANNLMPIVLQVAIGRRAQLQVYGADYATNDGTGVRDYIHVLDLVDGHLAALNYLQEHTGIHVHNLGTGRGFSVLEVVKTFERVSGARVPYEIVDRRLGDVATCFADAAKAARELGWTAKHDLEAMCLDAWRWQQRNPHGYRQ